MNKGVHLEQKIRYVCDFLKPNIVPDVYMYMLGIYLWQLREKREGNLTCVQFVYLDMGA